MQCVILHAVWLTLYRAENVAYPRSPTAPVQSSVKGLGELFAKNLKQLINQLFKEAQKESVVAQQTMESLAKDIQKERCVKSDMRIAFRFTNEDRTLARARARAPALPAAMAHRPLPLVAALAPCGSSSLSAPVSLTVGGADGPAVPAGRDCA